MILDMDFDFIVVGAGPVGSYLSRLLSEDGNSVAVFDRKREVGVDVVCSGVIGVSPYKEFNLPEESVIDEVENITFYSPSLIEYKYRSEKPVAYVVERKNFDRNLYSRAKDTGVEYFLGRTVVDVIRDKGVVKFKYLEKEEVREVSGRCGIISTGPNFALHRKVGLKPPDKFLWGREAEVGDSVEGNVEIFILDSPVPGSFGWIIPMGEKTRVGFLSEVYDSSALDSFVRRVNGKLDIPVDRMNNAPISYGESRKLVSDRIIAVGEAAGQVKTTTGGGIHYGLVGAKIAAEVLKKGLNEDDFSEQHLLEYERRWKLNMGKEIRAGMLIRSILKNIPSRVIDCIFKMANENSELQERLNRKLSFNFHSEIIDFGINLLSNKYKLNFRNYR